MESQLFILAGALGLAVLATWSAVAGLISLAPKMGLVDRPNERSLHVQVTPRGGGIGFVLPVALALGTLAVIGSMGTWAGFAPGMRKPGAIYLGAALFIAAVSLRDDLRSLGAGLRMICHLTAASVVAFAITSFSTVAIPGWGDVGLGKILGAALAIVWIVGLTNV